MHLDWGGVRVIKFMSVYNYVCGGGGVTVILVIMLKYVHNDEEWSQHFQVCL
jgi:hypothetical protein